MLNKSLRGTDFCFFFLSDGFVVKIMTAAFKILHHCGDSQFSQNVQLSSKNKCALDDVENKKKKKESHNLKKNWADDHSLIKQERNTGKKKVISFPQSLINRTKDDRNVNYSITLNFTWIKLQTESYRLCTNTGLNTTPPLLPAHTPTVLLVEVDLGLVLLSALQSLLHLLGHVLAGVGPVQEAAAAVLLHHLSSREARQFAEAVRAVDDGVATVTLGVTQQEIAVCRGVGEREGGSGGWKEQTCASC